MRESSIFENMTNDFLDDILKKPIGELAEEYDVSVECIKDLFTLADEIDTCLRAKLLNSEELRNEEISKYKVLDILTTRYYFKRDIVLLGTYLFPYVDITLTGNHGVSLSDYGVEIVDSLKDYQLGHKRKGYTFADAIKENEDRTDNLNIQYMFDSKEDFSFEEYSDENEDVFK